MKIQKNLITIKPAIITGVMSFVTFCVLYAISYEEAPIWLFFEVIEMKESEHSWHIVLLPFISGGILSLLHAIQISGTGKKKIKESLKFFGIHMLTFWAPYIWFTGIVTAVVALFMLGLMIGPCDGCFTPGP
ncbi:MAG: hypothetical protein HOE53_02655 [Candidatus Magasanikbacteria bacterium]|jgi:hypothetical protein|nr:hypothetical protein [Candidatus Magasanikbacteria bacterium]